MYGDLGRLPPVSVRIADALRASPTTIPQSRPVRNPIDTRSRTTAHWTEHAMFARGNRRETRDFADRDSRTAHGRARSRYASPRTWRATAWSSAQPSPWVAQLP